MKKIITIITLFALLNTNFLMAKEARVAMNHKYSDHKSRVVFANQTESIIQFSRTLVRTGAITPVDLLQSLNSDIAIVAEGLQRYNRAELVNVSLDLLRLSESIEDYFKIHTGTDDVLMNDIFAMFEKSLTDFRHIVDEGTLGAVHIWGILTVLGLVAGMGINYDYNRANNQRDDELAVLNAKDRCYSDYLVFLETCDSDTSDCSWETFKANWQNENNIDFEEEVNGMILPPLYFLKPQFVNNYGFKKYDDL